MMHIHSFVRSRGARFAASVLACSAVLSAAHATAFRAVPAESLASGRNADTPTSPAEQRGALPAWMAPAHAAKGAPAAQFFADFGSGCDIPADPVGFTVHDIDGQSPDPSVTPFALTWTVFNDYRHGDDCVAMSVSYFQPPGAADDWLIIDTPITPDAGTLLRWNAVAYFAGYRDGYEVRYSTTNAAPASFLANPPLLTVDAAAAVWTSQELSLAFLAGMQIHIAFRNPSDDMYLLALDDIYVGPRPDNDPAIEMVVDTFGDYAVVPDFLQVPFELSVVVRNAGTLGLTNVAAHAQIVAAGEPADAFAATPVATLAPDGTATVLLGAGTFDTVGDWTVATDVTADGSDGDPGNTTRLDRLMTVSASELRHADRRGLAGIANIDHYRYGQDFVLPRAAQLTGVTLAVIDNQSIAETFQLYAELYRWNETTRELGEMVNVLYADPEVYGGIMYVTLAPAWTPTLLPAGHYMLLTVQHPDYRLITRANRVLPETSWHADVVESGLSVTPIADTYPTAADLTWDFTLELAPPTPFADGFE